MSNSILSIAGTVEQGAQAAAETTVVCQMLNQYVDVAELGTEENAES